MATEYKVLGQVNPAASSASALYTVPASKDAVISTITVANISSASACTYDIAIRPNGDALANKHYIARAVSLAASDTVALTLGITLDADDVITVQASTASATFGAFGAEIT